MGFGKCSGRGFSIKKEDRIFSLGKNSLYDTGMKNFVMPIASKLSLFYLTLVGLSKDDLSIKAKEGIHPIVNNIEA